MVSSQGRRNKIVAKEDAPMKTVLVTRKGHPFNPIKVERSDMLKDDVIVDPNEPKKPAPKKKAARVK